MKLYSMFGNGFGERETVYIPVLHEALGLT